MLYYINRNNYELVDADMKFEILADSIKIINDKAGNAAKSAAKQLVTLRNWAIGVVK